MKMKNNKNYMPFFMMCLICCVFARLAAGEERYAIQVGTFRDNETARIEKAHYQEKGFNAYIIDVSAGIYHVMIGSFDNTEETEQVKKELYQKIKSIYSIHIASYRKKENAEMEKNRCQKIGFDAYTEPADLKEKGVWYRVLIGRFTTRELAEKEQEFMQRKLNPSYMKIVNKKF